MTKRQALRLQGPIPRALWSLAVPIILGQFEPSSREPKAALELAVVRPNLVPGALGRPRSSSRNGRRDPHSSTASSETNAARQPGCSDLVAAAPHCAKALTLTTPLAPALTRRPLCVLQASP